MTWLPYCPRLDLLSARKSVWEYYEGSEVARKYLARFWADRPAYQLVNLETWRKEPVVPDAYKGGASI